eukprot:tig00020943_g16247.t1
MKQRSVLGLLGLLLIVFGASAAPIAFESSGGALLANGAPFHVKALNWFGFETANNVFHGLWSKSADFFVNFIAKNGFNAVRVPFAGDLGLNDATPTGVDGASNPDLVGKSSLEVLDVVVAKLAKKNVLVMLDMHRPTASDGITELWYHGSMTEDKVIAAWKKMAARYCDNWNVFAADIKNGAATWGTGNDATDWDAAAARIGNAVLSVCPRWLIFVEGVERVDGKTGWWGGNLAAAAKHPVALSNPKRLVYSPHVYGPGVFMQTYFSDSSFPTNMPAIWDATIGSIAKQTGKAVIIGEWGSHYTGGAEQTWMDAFVSWLLKAGVSPGFFWCLNPNSGDTGGLLMDDWSTPHSGKLALLAKFPATNVAALSGSGAAAAADVADAPAPAPVAAPAPAPAPAAAKPVSGSCDVTYRLVRSWPEGFQGEIKVRAGTAVSSWTLEFDMPAGAKVEQMWGVSGVTQSGKRVAAKNTAHNGVMKAGEVETVGFVASRAAAAGEPGLPVNFEFNNGRC